MRSTFETAYKAKYGREALIKLRVELISYCNDNNINLKEMGFYWNETFLDRQGAGCFNTEDLIVVRDGLEELRRIEKTLYVVS
jgi:hypothetical protein